MRLDHNSEVSHALDRAFDAIDRHCSVDELVARGRLVVMRRDDHARDVHRHEAEGKPRAGRGPTTDS